MKRTIFSILLLLSAIGAAAREYTVFGPEGGISYILTLPEGFHPETDRCPMVILMHGIFASKDFTPMPALAKALAKEGIASIRFDFNGHGQSEGQKVNMTIEKELSDARSIWNYAQTLPYVENIGLLGHSQGGVIASMLAGRLTAEGAAPAALALLAPGSVIKDACRNGKFFNARFDPANPPEYIRCWGIYKLGREYLVSTQQLDIYGTASAYKGPALVLHGSRDTIVPMWCSEKYVETYGDKARFVVVEGENHTLTRKKKEVVAHVVAFFKSTLF